MTEPLFPQFNMAIVTISTELMPSGWVVSWDAPQTFEDLRTLMDAGGPMTIWAGSCDRSIYADTTVNHAFRAWHDWCHWKGDYDLSLKGEAAACQMQCQHLYDRYGMCELTIQWAAVLEAEINGQGAYYQWHKRFPDDQRAFVEAYLVDPQQALRWPLW